MVAKQQVSNARRVGELAAATGLTVRTLHYYEEIGLLVPSGRTNAGHRRYDDADVARLYRICLLRRLGLPLAEISRALDDSAWSLRAAMAAHLGELDRQLEAAGRSRTRLAVLLDSAGATDDGLSDELLALLEEVTMLDAAVQRRITLLVYADIAAAHEWLVRVFGLGPGQLHRDEQGRAVHGELYAGDGVIWMHQEEEASGWHHPDPSAPPRPTWRRWSTTWARIAAAPPVKAPASCTSPSTSPTVYRCTAPTTSKDTSDRS